MLLLEEIQLYISFHIKGFIFHLKYPYHSFSSHFYFLIITVLLILVFFFFVFCLFFSVSGCWNQYFLLFFYVVLEIYYRGNKAIFNTGKFSSSFFDTYIQAMLFLGCKGLCISFSFHFFLFHLVKFFLRPFQE